MKWRFLPAYLLLAVVLAAFFLATPVAAQAATNCEIVDSDDSNTDASTGAADSVEQVNEVDLDYLCVTESATAVEIHVGTVNSPTPPLGDTFHFTIEFDIGSSHKIMVHTEGAATAAVQCTSTTPTPINGATTTLTGNDIEYSIPKTEFGPSRTANFTQLKSSSKGCFVHDVGGTVTTRTDQNPDAGASIFPPTSPYRVGSRVPLTVDTDEDGSPDRYEYANGTDPFSIDTDHDGLLDGGNKTIDSNSTLATSFTRAQILVVAVNGTNVTFGGEAGFGTNATLPDTDGDGLLDGGNMSFPKNDPNITYLAAFNVTAYAPLSNTTHDFFLGEYAFGSNATNSDTDGEGFSDFEEVTGANNTAYRQNARFPGLAGSTDPAAADTDADNLTDFQELNGIVTLPNGTTLSFSPTNPNVADTDLDGLSDGDEILKHHTDPVKQDSDGDNYSDGDEVDQGKDPNDSADYPGKGQPGGGGTTKKDVNVAYLGISTVALLIVGFLCIAGIVWRWS